MADAIVNLRIRLDDQTSGNIRRIRASVAQLNAALAASGGARGPRQTAAGLNRTAVSANNATSAVRRLQLAVSSFATTSGRQLAVLNRRLAGLRGGFAGIGAGLGVGALATGLIGSADAALQLQARLRIVADTSEDVARVQQRLFEVSQETRTSFLENAKVFSRLSIATEQLGTSEDDLIKVITGVNKAVLLSGATAQEANAGIIQLTQGISSNRFQGDELRSVLENLVVVGDSLAKTLGTNIGGLRRLGESGELTRETLVPALIEISDLVEERFSRLPVTLGQATTRIRNSLLNLFEGDEAQPLIDTFNDLAKQLEDPSIQKSIQDLTRAFASLGAFGVEAFVSIIQIINPLVFRLQRIFIQLNGLGSLIADIANRGLDAFRDIADGTSEVVDETNRKLDELTIGRVDKEKEANEEILNAVKNASEETRAEARKTASELLASSAARQQRIEREIDATKAKFKELDDRVKEVKESLDELAAPPERSTDAFIAQAERLADVRRLDILLQQGQAAEALKLARALRQEAKDIDDGIQSRFIETAAKRVQEEATRLEIEAIDDEREALEKRNKELEAGQLELTIPPRVGELVGVVGELISESDAEFVESANALIDKAESPPEPIKIIDPIEQDVIEDLNLIADGLTRVENFDAALELETNLPEVEQQTTSLNAQLQNTVTIFERLVELAQEFSITSPQLGGESQTAGIRGKSGGRLPGFGGGDRVPALLERGEFIVRKESTRKNLALLQAINAGNNRLSKFVRVRAFREGGPVGFESSITDVGGVINRTPVTIVLPSGERLNLQQGEDSVEKLKQTVRREALKVGRRTSGV